MLQIIIIFFQQYAEVGNAPPQTHTLLSTDISPVFHSYTT